MKAFKISVVLFAIVSVAASAQERNSGFYKDIFMDSGLYLTPRRDLPAARALGLSYETFVSTKKKTDPMTESDSLLQVRLIAGNELDENGILLYPDGQPRFRMVYMNGGSAGKHGRTLNAGGRANYKAFVEAGGSYVGTCAGAFIAAEKQQDTKGTYIDRPYYIKLWGGTGCSTGMKKTWTGMDLPKGSALLKYGDFGKDHHVDSVRHNGGCFGDDFPKGTEILATYDTEGMQTKRDVNGKPSIWAFKAGEKSGRIIMCGSHPEGKTTGRNLTLMEAMVKYALDGTAGPVLKGTLKAGDRRSMTARTSDKDPDYTRIGDRQYHHFLVDVPSGATKVTVDIFPVKGWNDYDLYLYAAPGGFAFNDNAVWSNVNLKARKTLIIDEPKPGKLYVSVYCATTVDAVQTKFGESYTGRVDVLNGVPYEIQVKIAK